MNPVERRDQQRQEVRERILAAARELLLAEGIAGFSMRKLAAKVGYTATAIYFHFADKGAVLQTLMDADCVALRRAFDAAGGEPDPVERVRQIGLAYVRFGLTHPDHYRFLMMTRAAGEVLDPANVRRGDPTQDAYAFLKQAVADGIAAGRYRAEFADADELSQVVWAGVHGIVALHLTLGNDPWFDWRPAEPTARHVIDSMLRGVVADPRGR